MNVKSEILAIKNVIKVVLRILLVQQRFAILNSVWDNKKTKNQKKKKS